MQIKGKENFNAVEYLRTTLTSEVLDYVNRVAHINVAEPEKFEGFFKTLLAELQKVATNRKFLVLNTNVIRETHARVLASDSVRMFYMELITSLRVRIDLELGENVFETLVKSLVTSYSHPSLREDLNQQALVPQTSGERQLAGQITIQPAAAGYIQTNQWYLGIILCNFFAASILDQMQLIRNRMDKSPAANKANQ
jgi:hypothetical protein